MLPPANPVQYSTAMYQLTLDVRPQVEPSLANYVVGPNTALLEALRAQIEARDGSWLYLWGAPGTGRSHLLQAACLKARANGRPSACLPAEQGAALLCEQAALLAMDDVDRLDAEGQAMLFRALIQAREARASLILAGNAPPQALKLREDLRTRIGQALVFEIQPLDDAAKGMLLIEHASARGMALEAELVEYLLRHGHREQGWLMNTLDALDEASLSQARPVTLPLLREILQDRNEPELPFF